MPLLIILAVAVAFYLFIKLKQVKDELKLKQVELTAKNNKSKQLKDELQQALEDLNDYKEGKEYNEKLKEVEKLKEDLKLYQEELDDHQYGFYNDENQKWCLESIGGYTEMIKEERQSQRRSIKDGYAVEDNWKIDSREDYEDMERIKKLTISSFNNSCDIMLSNCRDKDFDVIKLKIEKEAEKINKMCPKGIWISEWYIESKVDEASLRIELEDRRGNLLLQEDDEKIEDELSVYEDGLEKAREGLVRANKELETAEGDEADKYIRIKQLLEQKIEEIEARVEEDKAILKNKKKGWIYFVSDIQNKGQIKVGLTRRTDPMVRIEELSSSAGSPFKLTVHGIMQVDDCFKVENDFHNYFRKQIVNSRKEWFWISVKDAQKALEEKGFDLILQDDIVHSEYERNKKRWIKEGIAV